MIIAETSSLFDQIPSLRHGFFARHGGVSEGHFSSLNCSLNVGDNPQNVWANRQKAVQHLGLSQETQMFLPNLSHSNRVHYLTSMADLVRYAQEPADAVITTMVNCPLSVTYADCLPILLTSSDGQEIASVHAGWRGLYSGVILNTVARMHTKPIDMMAAIGPCVSKEGYFVGEDLFRQFREHYPFATHHTDQGFQIDLLHIAMHQLKTLGVCLIEKVGHLTDMSTNNYFSHRKEQGKTGRMIAVIAKILH